MKNKKNIKNPSTKKWFYIAVAFGIVFAIITTFIAICRNIKTTPNTDLLNNAFVETEKKKEDVEKTTEQNKNKTKDEQNKEEKNEEEIEKNKEDKEDEEETTKKSKIDFVSPVKNGKIINEFSNEKPVFWKALGEWKTHDAVDIEAKKNTTVKAAADGTISEIKNEDSTWGICITIEHKNGFKSYYKGLSEQIQVKLNQKVKAGDVIGLAGGKINKIEKDLKEHLHFMLEKDEKWVNPKDYIKF